VLLLFGAMQRLVGNRVGVIGGVVGGHVTWSSRGVGGPIGSTCGEELVKRDV